MIEIISSYPTPFILAAIILIFLILFLCIKYSKGKTKKVEQAIKTEKTGESKSEEPPKSQPKEKQEEVETQEEVGEKTDDKDNPPEKLKKEKRVKKAKKSVEQVFKRDTETGKVVVSEDIKSSISEEELLSRMGFVTSTKKVSKLVKLPETNPITSEVFIEHPPEEEMIPEDIKHDKDNCKYFNKSRRLSKFVEENNFDEMFAEHLSEHYLNIDISKHLDLSDERTNKLYERASKTLANSDVRLITDEDNESVKYDKKLAESYREDRRREIFADLIESRNEREESRETLTIDENSLDDDIKLDSKTILVADALLKRKGKK